MKNATGDRHLLQAERLQERVRSGSLGELVEWVTALAWCLRSAANGTSPERDILKIAQEFITSIDAGQLPRGPEADERQKRVAEYVDCVQPGSAADLLEELAESLRQVLQFDDTSRLERFNRVLRADMALANCKDVRDLVALDRAGDLNFTIYELDREMLRGAVPAPA